MAIDFETALEIGHQLRLLHGCEPEVERLRGAVPGDYPYIRAWAALLGASSQSQARLLAKIVCELHRLGDIKERIGDRQGLWELCRGGLEEEEAAQIWAECDKACWTLPVPAAHGQTRQPEKIGGKAGFPKPGMAGARSWRIYRMAAQCAFGQEGAKIADAIRRALPGRSDKLTHAAFERSFGSRYGQFLRYAQYLDETMLEQPRA